MKLICLFIIILTFSYSSGWAQLSIPALPHQLRSMPELYKSYPTLDKILKERAGAIFMVFAHPDDELTVLPQVINIKNQFPDRPIFWILVSDAEKGMVLPFTCQGKKKGLCRFEEAKKVSDCSGLPFPIPLGFPDGKIREVPELESLLWKLIDERSPEGVGAIFTSDEAGLYGHPDHMAVHDSLRGTAKTRGIPLITAALPDLMKKKLKLREPAVSEGRQRPAITHVLNLDLELKRKSSCSASAYRSQALLIRAFMQFLSPEKFYDTVPKVFLSVQ